MISTGLKLKHILLVLGTLSVFVSFLFYGRQQGIYQLLLLSGLFISLIGYLWIAFGKGSKKSKLIWTTFVLLSMYLQWLSEPLLIKNSHLIYLNAHEAAINEVNAMLLNSNDDISIFYDAVLDSNEEFTHAEKERLIKLLAETEAYMIIKSENGTYFGLWGMLDARIGLTYSNSGNKPTIKSRLLKAHWYY